MNELKTNGLDTTHVWRGKHKHISYEIKYSTNDYVREHSFNGNTGHFCSYITILRANIPKEFDALIPEFDKELGGRRYYSNPVCDAVPMRNGGCTFFEVIRADKDGEIIGFKIGNDYNHSWNNDDSEYFGGVQRDVKSAINDFVEAYPKYKAWSNINGKYYPATRLAYFNAKAQEALDKKYPKMK